MLSVITSECQLSPQRLQPEPFCTFCLRERPPNNEFHKHVIGSSTAMRQSLQALLGYDFQLSDFAVCQPCWKLIQLIQDFRLRCFKASGYVERIGRGLGADDGWFSAKNLATIESIRLAVEDQMRHIEKINVTRRALALDDSIGEVEDELLVVENPSEDEVAEQSTSRYQSKRDESESDEAYQSTSEDDRLLESEITLGETKVELTEMLDEPADTRYVIEIVECPKCHRIFTNTQGLANHRNYCNVSQPAFVHKCDICAMTLRTAKRLKAHLNIHKGIATYTCSKHCNMTFFSESGIRYHEQRCVTNPQTCSFCKKVVPNKVSLIDHLKKSHAGEVAHECEICRKRFLRKYNLGTHMKHKHSGIVNPLSCEQCGKIFQYKGSLTHHLKVHNKDV